MGIVDTVSITQVAPLLNVIVKIYLMRLHKLKSGTSAPRKQNTNDRRMMEHLAVWLIRSKTKKMDTLQSIGVVDDNCVIIRDKFALHDGQITIKQFNLSFAKWCTQYIGSNGRHSDSKLLV